MTSVDTCEAAARAVMASTIAILRNTPLVRMCVAPLRVSSRVLLRRRLAGVQLHPLQVEAVRSIAGLQVDDATFAEACDRPTERQAHALEQPSLRIHDIVDELTMLGLRRRRRQDPEIAIEIRHR